MGAAAALLGVDREKTETLAHAARVPCVRCSAMPCIQEAEAPECPSMDAWIGRCGVCAHTYTRAVPHGH